MDCSHYAAGRCRSCSVIGQPYAEQLAAKVAHCRVLLAAKGEVEWLPPVASAESGFRNKAKMVVSGSCERPVLGIVDAQGQGYRWRTVRFIRRRYRPVSRRWRRLFAGLGSSLTISPVGVAI